MLTDPRCKGVCKNGERCSMEGGNPMIPTFICGAQTAKIKLKSCSAEIGLYRLRDLKIYKLGTLSPSPQPKKHDRDLTNKEPVIREQLLSTCDFTTETLTYDCHRHRKCRRCANLLHVLHVEHHPSPWSLQGIELSPTTGCRRWYWWWANQR